MGKTFANECKAATKTGLYAGRRHVCAPVALEGRQLARRVADIIFELYGTKGDFDLTQINDLLEPAESEKLTAALDNVVIAGKADEVLAECLQNNTLRLLREREKRVLDLLSLADEEANADSARELTLELMEIQREMKAHGGKKHVK